MPSHPDPRPNTTRRVRLKGFDYRTPGYYFITICEKDRRNLFSRVSNQSLSYSPAGHMLVGATHEISFRFRNTELDTYIVMPNHVHLLLGVNLKDLLQEQDSLIDAVGWWKTVTTKRYIEGVNLLGWPRFDGKLWQEGYHDRIVRDQRELDYIRHYIEQNPVRWEEDTFYEE